MNVCKSMSGDGKIRFLKLPVIIFAAVFFAGMASENLYAFGRNIVFDGQDDYAELTTEDTVDVGYDSDLSFTVDFWVYPTDYGCMISDDAYDIGYTNVDSSDSIYFRLWDVSKWVMIYLPVDIFNGWHHVSCMFDNPNDRAAIGVDGDIYWVEDLDIDDSLYDGDWPLVIGAFASDEGFFAGKIDEMRISDSLRYSGDTYSVPTLAYTDDLNTLALWHFDEVPGSTSFFDSSGAGNTLTGYNGCTTEGTVDDEATVTGTISYPSDASGATYQVMIDNDLDGDNGVVAYTSGICAAGTSVDYTMDDVPAGSYYAYAIIRNVTADDVAPEPGDFIGLYGGTFANPPTSPNFVVPSSGTVTCDIELFLYDETENDLPFMIEDFEGSFEDSGTVGFLPYGWSMSNDTGEVEFYKGTQGHHGSGCLSADAYYEPDEFTMISTILTGDPGSIVSLQIQYKVETTLSPSATEIAQIRAGTELGKQITIFYYGSEEIGYEKCRIDDIEIPSDGEISFYLGVAHLVVDGCTTVDFDCLTSDNSSLAKLNSEPSESDEDIRQW